MCFSIFAEIISSRSAIFRYAFHSIFTAYAITSKIINISGTSDHFSVFVYIPLCGMEPVIFSIYAFHSLISGTIRFKVIRFPFIICQPFIGIHDSVTVYIIDLPVILKKLILIEASCIRIKIVFLIVYFFPSGCFLAIYMKPQAPILVFFSSYNPHIQNQYQNHSRTVFPQSVLS